MIGGSIGSKQKTKKKQRQERSFLKSNNVMGNILYTVAVILVILWAVGYLGFHAGGIIHILLVIAVVVILLRVIQGKKTI